MHKLPPEHLDLTLRDVLALATGAPPPHGEPIDVSTIAAAVEALAKELAAEARTNEREQKDWLAQQFDELTDSIEVPEHA